MRAELTVLLASVLAGACFPTTAGNGSLVCGDNAARRCPAGYHCAADNTCWHNGQDPLLDGGQSDMPQLQCVAQPKLTVLLAGDGAGSVTGAQISCPTTCQACFETGAAATLSAQPDATSAFAGWSGDCTGSADCNVTVDQDRTVTATFNHLPVTLTVSNVGFQSATGAVVVTPGSSCTTTMGTCAISEPAGAQVTLRIVPDARFGFQGWTGDCAASGTKAICTLTMNAPHSVTARFAPLNYVFVTSGSFSSHKWGATADTALANADAYCNQKATGKLAGKFVAWLSTAPVGATPGVDAAKRLANSAGIPARGWIRADGRPFADSIDALTKSNQIFFPPLLDESGNEVRGTGASVATGTKSDGTISGQNCQNWTSNANTDTYTSGQQDTGGNGYWTEVGAFDTCNSTVNNMLYCFGVDYATALIVVPPTNKRLAFLTKDPFPNAAAGLAAADQQCATDASAAGLGGTFKAVLAATGATAASRFDLTGPAWARTDGIQLDMTANAFFANQNHMSALNVAADGLSYCYGVSGVSNTCLAWVGGASPTMAGTDANTCKSWTYNLSSTTYEAMFGDTTSVSSSMLSAGTSPLCNSATTHLYCLQQ